MTCSSAISPGFAAIAPTNGPLHFPVAVVSLGHLVSCYGCMTISMDAPSASCPMQRTNCPIVWSNVAGFLQHASTLNGTKTSLQLTLGVQLGRLGRLHANVRCWTCFQETYWGGGGGMRDCPGNLNTLHPPEMFQHKQLLRNNALQHQDCTPRCVF